MTVGQLPAYDFNVTTSRKLFFLSPFRTVLSAIHMQVTDRPSPDAPFSNPGNNCANGLLQREQGGKQQKNYTENKLRGPALKVPAFELVLSVCRVIVRTHAPCNDTNR